MNEIVSPQVENGHIDIAIEIAEALYHLQLSGNQWRLLWVILRQTWGWHKKYDRISITSFERQTGLKRRHIVRAINDMVNRNIVTKNDTNRITSYGFNKHYDKWLSLPKMTVPKNDTTIVTKNDTTSLPKMTPPSTKETNKRKETKETIIERFEKFWTSYPKKVGKKECIEKWKALNPSEELLQKILSAIEKQKEWRAKAASGDFRPEWKDPIRWLKKESWEDEIDKQSNNEPEMKVL